jgi:hypothetical protein
VWYEKNVCAPIVLWDPKGLLDQVCQLFYSKRIYCYLVFYLLGLLITEWNEFKSSTIMGD